METIVKEIRLQLRAFFSAFPWKNLLLFSFFLLIAFGFWLMLFTRKENVEGRYIIPIKYINVAYDEVFNTPPLEAIEFIIRDVGLNIFMNSLSRRDSLVIDVASYRERGITTIQGTEMQFLIQQVFPTALSVASNPPSISLETSRLESRELPIVFSGEITTGRANLVADTVFFVPETVTALGSQQVLDELREASTEFTVFRNMRATSQLPIAINAVEGVRFVPNEVEVFISINEFTERTIEVPITVVNIPENLGVKFFPSRIAVSFSVTLEEYRRISPEDFAIKLDYRDFYANENGRVALALTSRPASIVNPRLSPSTVEFLFEDR